MTKMTTFHDVLRVSHIAGGVIGKPRMDRDRAGSVRRVGLEKIDRLFDPPRGIRLGFAEH